MAAVKKMFGCSVKKVSNQLVDGTHTLDFAKRSGNVTISENHSLKPVIKFPSEKK